MRIAPLRAALTAALLPVLLAACMIDPRLLNPEGTGGSGAPPPPINRTVGTDDGADSIQMTSAVGGAADQVTICLNQNRGDGWWKGLGINSGNPTLELEGADTRCQPVRAGSVTVAFWKAKAFGVHTAVGTRSFDLSAYGGHQITFAWTAD